MRIVNSRAPTQQRLETRHAVPRAECAYVEFDYPQSTDRRRRLSLLDLSSAGVCFALPFYGLSGFSCATNLVGVIVRVRGRAIDGELVVAHVTRESNSRVRCGARFYPSTESDRLQLLRAIDNLDALAT